MGSSSLSGARLLWRGVAAVGANRILVFAILVFSGAIAVAYAPSVLQVFGIHNDYEMLYTRSLQFFHPEAAHQFAIGRPICALFTNLTVLPLEYLADYRWTRLFAILTVCVLGAQMITNCVFRLHTRARDAVAIALATFLVPAFFYSVTNASAWAPHLLTILIAFGAYTVLGRSNLQSISFLILAKRQEYGTFCRQLFAYAGSRPVWTSCLLYQLALYDYPPIALILALFPVIGILFSQTPRAYRTLIALRDIVFIGVNLVIYFLSAKLIYLPFVRLFMNVDAGVLAAEPLSPFAARVRSSYAFELGAHPLAVLERLENLMSVAGDLWFLPQAQIHIASGAVLMLAIGLATGVGMLARRRAAVRLGASMARLSMESWRAEGVVAAVVVVVCFVISGAAVLLSLGGFIVYRTTAISTAMAAIVLIYAIGAIARMIWTGIGNPFHGDEKVADMTLALMVCAALGASFYANDTTMKLARNEFAYFTGIVQRAIEAKTKTIILIDPRPLFLSEDIPMVYDQGGRWVPPYEAGCFSGYCMQTGSILHIAAAELGRPKGEFQVIPMRGDDPVPGITCDMLTAPAPSYPSGASVRSVEVINYYRTLAPLSCVEYSLAWYDLRRDPGR